MYMFSVLKRHNRAKIIKKSVILFWLLNMSIIFEHVHRLELRKSVKLFVYFLFGTCMSKINFRPYFSLGWYKRNPKFYKKSSFDVNTTRPATWGRFSKAQPQLL